MRVGLGEWASTENDKNQNRVVKDFYTVKSLAFSSEKSFCHKFTNQGENITSTNRGRLSFFGFRDSKYK